MLPSTQPPTLAQPKPRLPQQWRLISREIRGSEDSGSTAVNEFLTFVSQTPKAVATETRIHSNASQLKRRKRKVSMSLLATNSARISLLWFTQLMGWRAQQPEQLKDGWHLVSLGNGSVSTARWWDTCEHACP